MNFLEENKNITDETGLSLVEVLIAMTIVVLVSAGIVQIFNLAFRTVQTDTKNAISSGTLSIFRRSFVADVNTSSGVVISSLTNPNISQSCTTWNSSDSSFQQVRPLLTIHTNSLDGAESVYIGYELRQKLGNSDLWRIQCLSLGSGSTVTNSNTLLSSLPKPADFVAKGGGIKVIDALASAGAVNASSSFPYDRYFTLNSGSQIKSLSTAIQSMGGATSKVTVNDSAGIVKGMIVSGGSGWTTQLSPFTTISSVANDEISLMGNTVAASANVNAKVTFSSPGAIQFSMPAGKNSKAIVVTAARRVG